MTHTVPLVSAESQIRVLVVDDDRPLRETLERLLVRQGYLVSTADGAESALALLERTEDVSLIISDIDMPGRSGRELLIDLRLLYPDTAVIMLTGRRDVDSAVACLTMGASDYLAKPVQSSELRARVEKALTNRNAAVEMRRLRERYVFDLESQVRVLGSRNQAMFLAQVQMAVTMLEAKSRYTKGHSDRVAVYAEGTAVRMGLSADFAMQIRLGGQLHDIGKIGTRDSVLNKEGSLTSEEFAEIRRHTTDGESMLSVLREDHPEVLQIVRSHHERLDGSGFPDGLRGESIPLPARIVCVVDAFDAMTSARSYGQVRTPEWAVKELRRVSGTHFDPNVVNAFLTAFPNLGTPERAAPNS